jgi:ABC-type multidrug transport system fused ATPase/permease subunit
MSSTSAAPAPVDPNAIPPMSPRLLIRWARFGIAPEKGPFAIATFLAVVTPVLGLYLAQLFVNVAGLLGDKAPGAAAAGNSFFNRSILFPSSMVPAVILLVVVGFLTIGVQFANQFAVDWSGARMLRRLQLVLHDKLIQLGPAYHARNPLGRNTMIVTRSAIMAAPVLREFVTFPLTRGATLLVAAVLLYGNLTSLDAPGYLKGVLVALVLILPLAGYLLSRRLGAFFGAVQQADAAVNDELVNSISAPQEVQMMNAAARRAASFDRSLLALMDAKIKAAWQNAITTQFQGAVPTTLQILLLIVAVVLKVRNPTASVEGIIGVYLFVPRVVEPVQGIIRYYTGLTTAWPQIYAVGAILDQESEIADKGVKDANALDGADIAFQGVTFAYPGTERKIVDNISHLFADGSVTAIVGRSGSGKSSIIKLIARLQEPQAGRITLGGVPIPDLKLDALRSSLGSVSQFPLYLEGDVRDNLRLADASATDAEMEDVCRQAGIWPVLEKQNPGDPLAAHISRQQGTGLSGGERRLLVIARALLARPKVLLLDEPSTGVDNETLGPVIDAIGRVKEGRTVILIDHDMELVRTLADQVCCLEDGRFTDVGTPEELLQRPSLFQRLSTALAAHGLEPGMEITGKVPVPKVADPQAAKVVAGRVVGPRASNADV